MTYDRVYRWRKYDQSLYGRRCRVVARGKSMNSCLIEFADGTQHVVSRYAIKRAK